MKKNIQILSCVLVLQIALLFFFQNKKNPTAVYSQTENLLTIETKNVDKLEIVDSQKQTVILTKINGEWVLPSTFNFPVSKTKISKFVEKLSNLKRSWPVGKTQIAAKQFSVTDEKFEKKIILFENNNTVQTIYIGTSPSFKKVHTRLDSEDNTFTINFNSYDLSTNKNDWLDKEYFRIEKDNVEELVFEKVHLRKTEKTFMVVNNKDENLEFDQEKISRVMSKAINPNFESVLAENTYAHGEKILSYDVVSSSKKITFNYYQEQKSKSKSDKSDTSSDEENVVLKLSEHPYFFSVSKADLKDLMNLEPSSMSSKVESSKMNSEDLDTDHKKMAKSK